MIVSHTWQAFGLVCLYCRGAKVPSEGKEAENNNLCSITIWNCHPDIVWWCDKNVLHIIVYEIGSDLKLCNNPTVRVTWLRCFSDTGGTYCTWRLLELSHWVERHFRFSYTLGGWWIQFYSKAFAQNASAFDWSCQDLLPGKKNHNEMWLDTCDWGLVHTETSAGLSPNIFIIWMLYGGEFDW